jgi:hypothetical protein
MSYPANPPFPDRPEPRPADVAAMRRKVTGGELLNAAWALLSKDRELIWLPVLSSIFATIAVLPFLATGAFFEISAGGDAAAKTGLVHWIVRALLLFATLFVATTVAVFFQVALVSAIFERIEGGDPTIGSAINAAWNERVRIVQWAFLTAVVGTIIRLISERIGGIGEIIIRALAGVAWAVASLFVVPIIVAEGLGPIDALKRSASIVSTTWGKALRSGIRFGITQFVVMLIPFGIIVIGAGLMASGNTVGLVSGGAIIALGVIVMVIISIVFNALGTALNAMVYRFGAGLPVPGIDVTLLASAIQTKKK